MYCRYHPTVLTGLNAVFSGDMNPLYVPKGALKKGLNTIELSVPKSKDNTVYWEFKGSKYKKFNKKVVGNFPSISKIKDKDGAIFISDAGTGSVDFANVSHTFYNLRMGTGVFKFECKLIKSNNETAVCFRAFLRGGKSQLVCISKRNSNIKGIEFFL